MSTKKTQIKEKKANIGQCLEQAWEKFSASRQSWLEFAKCIVEIIDEFDNGKEKIQVFFESKGERLSKFFWNRIEDVGRARMHWRLLPGMSEGGSTEIRQLPYSDQNEIFEQGKKYPLLLEGGDNIMVDVRQLGRDQAKQIFGDGYIRDLTEQKAYLSSRTEKEVTEIIDPYRITSRGLLVTKENTLFTKANLREILIQM